MSPLNEALEYAAQIKNSGRDMRPLLDALKQHIRVLGAEVERLQSEVEGWKGKATDAEERAVLSDALIEAYRVGIAQATDPIVAATAALFDFDVTHSRPG
jgi:hypothetical protein